MIQVTITERAAVTEALTAVRPLALPAAAGTGGMPVPVTVTATLVLLSPVGTVSPAARPAFTLTVDTASTGAQVEVQYGTAPDLTGAASVLVPAPAGQGAAQVAVQAAADLPDGVTYWRARLVAAAGTTAWTVPAQFAVISDEGEAQLAGSWTIAPAAVPATHLWYIDHNQTGTDSGAEGVLVGTGFGAAPQVMLGDLPCPVTAVTTIAPAGGEPAIVPGGTCTPWHQQIAFVIPGVDPDHDGDALTVIGGL